MVDDLSRQLWRFLKIVKEKLIELDKNNKLKKDIVPYHVTRILNFKSDMGNLSYNSTSHFEEKEQWNDKNRFDVIELIKSIDEYPQLIAYISTNYNLSNEQAAHNLDIFLNRFIGAAIGTEITDDSIVDSITIFIGDLDGHSIKWDIKVWIKGLWLDKEYQIYDGLKIRTILPADLEKKVPIYHIGLERMDKKEGSRAVLEFIIRSKDEEQLRNEIQIIITCFRLFRLGSVDSISVEFKPKSFLNMGHTNGKIGSDFAPIYRYHLQEEDVPKLVDLITRIKTLTPKDAIIEDKQNICSQSIALQRYNDSLLNQGNMESRITTAINSLEALYLKKDERVELSHRLGQRASILLGFFDIHTIKAYKDLHRAYEIRSYYIHGSYNEAEANSKSVYELTQTIMDYTRISLLIFLQLMKKIDKEALINKIDNSLLDNDARNKLKELVIANCKVYK